MNRESAQTRIIDSKTGQSATYETALYNVDQYICFATQAVIANSAALNIEVTMEGSLDQTNWATITGSNQTFTADGTYLWNFENAGFPFVRMRVAFTAGTADITFKGYAKN